MRKKIIVPAIALLVALSFGCQSAEQSDTRAPDEVTELTALGGDGEIAVSWKEPGDSDYSGLEILGDNGLPRVYIAREITGTTIPDCENGVAYTLSVRTIDASKNKSDGVTVTATPKAAPRSAFTVDFDVDGGSAVASLTNVAGGSLISAPTPPTKAGYRFKNWYISDLTTAWDFSADKVYSDMTLHARWNSAPAPVVHTAALPTLANLTGTWQTIAYGDVTSSAHVVVGTCKITTNKAIRNDGNFFEFITLEDTYFDPEEEPRTTYLAYKGSYSYLGDCKLRETTTHSALSLTEFTETTAPWTTKNTVDEQYAGIIDGRLYPSIFVRSGTGDSLVDSWVIDYYSLKTDGDTSYQKMIWTFSDTTLKQRAWVSEDGAYATAPTAESDAPYVDNGNESISVSGKTLYFLLAGNMLAIKDEPIENVGFKKL